jgi:hypothetical protein
MAREEILQPHKDEDTQPFLGHPRTGHVTTQSPDGPEQQSDNSVPRRTGPEHTPSQLEDQKRPSESC